MTTETTLTYTVKFERTAKTNTPLLRVAFGAESQNDNKVVDAKTQVDAIRESGVLTGDLLLVNGPVSMPVAFVLAHGVGHLTAAIAAYDPKVGGEGGGYIVSIAHGGKYKIGQIIPARDI